MARYGPIIVSSCLSDSESGLSCKRTVNELCGAQPAPVTGNALAATTIFVLHGTWRDSVNDGWGYDVLTSRAAARSARRGRGRRRASGRMWPAGWRRLPALEARSPPAHRAAHSDGRPPRFRPADAQAIPCLHGRARPHRHCTVPSTDNGVRAARKVRVFARYHLPATGAGSPSRRRIVNFITMITRVRVAAK